jgi:hypothetical protein
VLTPRRPQILIILRAWVLGTVRPWLRDSAKPWIQRSLALLMRRSRRPWIPVGAVFVIAMVSCAAVIQSDPRWVSPQPVASQAPVIGQSPNPTSSPKRPYVAAFIGDSYTAGTAATVSDKRFTTLIARAQGWTEVNFGRGGTGYVLPVGDPRAAYACGLKYCPSYTEMIASLAEVKVDIVVVSGGRNEYARSTSEFFAGVEAFFAALRAAAPHARIVATSPIWDDDPVPPSLPQMCTAVKWAVATVGGTYVDLGDPLLGHPEYVSEDRVHPNDAGHAAIARAFSAVYLP